jgi:hypothetical protein
LVVSLGLTLLVVATLVVLALPWIRSQIKIARQREAVDALLKEVQRLGGQADYQTDFEGSVVGLLVDLSGTNANDQVFVALARMPGFRHVNNLGMSDTRVTDQSLQILSQIRPPGLRDLNVARTRVGNGGLETITNLSTLSTLDLVGTEITDRGLEVFAARSSSKYLGSIDLTDTWVTAAGIARLSKAFPSLSINHRSARAVGH